MSDVKSIILEIRAGVGGNEAFIFAADLANMYSSIRRQTRLERRYSGRIKNELGG